MENQSTVIENISEWIQEDSFLEYLASVLSQRGWRPNDNYLPNSDLVGKIVPKNEDVVNEAKKSEPLQRNSLAMRRGRVVAMINGYSYEKDLSVRNSTADKIRIIHSAGDGNNKIYLSIDIK